MTNISVFRYFLFTWIILFPGVVADSQNNDCKVIMPSISGKYTGECKKGVAHGQGASQGIDSYTGNFRNGLPDGSGTYIWANGSRYEGFWSKGMKDGTGKMVTLDSTYAGVWKEDVYMGREVVPSYRITRSYNITKSSFFKSKSTNDVVRIRFFQGAVEYGGMKSVDIAFNSGELYRDGNIHGIQHPAFPIEVRISFTAENSFGTSQFNGNLDFTISEPGAWDVRISY